tara:strand:- start:3576 stop:5675 length:2100 start_codon:yes stop_codon:yes gene_type:complete
MLKKFLIFLLIINYAQGTTFMDIKPPTPKKIPHELTAHGDTRIDNYYWLRDDTRSSTDIIEYLESENIYLDHWLKSQPHDYRETIVSELLSQVPPEEISFPIIKKGYSYYEKKFTSQQLPVYYRKYKGVESKILDPNIKFQKQKYYAIGSVSPSADNKIIAFSEDNTGRRKYIVKFLNIDTNTNLEDKLEMTNGNVYWTNDSKKVIYLKKDPITLISNKVYLHELGTSQDQDILIYEENDIEFNMTLSKSTSNEYLLINIEKTNSNEYRLININASIIEANIFLPRRDDHLYYVDHFNKDFYIRSNYRSPNFKIFKTSQDNIDDINNWDTLIDHDKDRLISNFLITKKSLVLETRFNGLPKIEIFSLSDRSSKSIQIPEPTYFVSLLSNEYLNLDQNKFHYVYSSLTNPSSIYEYSIDKHNQKLVWKKEILGHNDDDFITERRFIKSRDNKDIPVSLIYKDGTDLKSPILFYGYGSYGINTESSFRSSIIPLLDRGIIFAIINIRGGSEMGRHWYEDGRMLNKINTFNDFNDAVKSIIDMGIGDPNNIFAQGGSAGGLLMGAIINDEPELYKGVLSGVPFVDVITTMSDPSIPLTTFEYDEWGNPANKNDYEYIKLYSPYDNIKELNYPSLLVTSSLYDSQVQYFEPAKYVPKLRDYNQSDNPILLKMNLIGGHGGKSGRLNEFEEIALEHNFILNLID